MKDIWFIGDTHFGHENILKFKFNDEPLRPFDSIEEMNQTLIENWNKVVGPNDRVYHLGDVALHPKYLPIISSLKGKKILIKGNHDTATLSTYSKLFEDVRGAHILSAAGIELILTHVPIHPDCLFRWAGNIHGHLHKHKLEDPRYFNVSVEQINYTPIHIEEVLQHYPPIMQAK